MATGALALGLSLLLQSCHGIGFGVSGGMGVRTGELPADATPVQQWMAEADEGDPAAQYMVGLMFDEGVEVEANGEVAAYWYRRAAEQGHPAAENNLGLLYYRGAGVPHSFEQAAAWFQRSADHGFTAAAGNLGVLYMLGQGVPQDHDQARRLLQRAADEGNAKSIRALAMLEVAEAARAHTLVGVVGSR